jgi:sodium transport system permease protein
MKVGSRLSTVGLVYTKELRETLRDRRTIMVMVLFPMVVYPLMSLLIAQVMASKATKTALHASRVAISAPPAQEAIMKARLQRAPLEFALPDHGTATDIEAGTLDALLIIDAPSGAATGTTSVSIVYDETRELSSAARDRLDKALSAALPVGCAALYQVRDRSIAPEAKVGGYMLSKILPLVVVIMVMLGAFYPAIDITAGERERGTLETILSSPVNRFDLMTGKVLAVSTLAAVTGMLNLISISLTMVEGMRLIGGSQALQIPWSRTIAALTMVVPSAFLFASVMVAIGAMARSFKEAQNLLTPIYFLCITPALIAGLGDYEMKGIALVVPGVNVTLLARAIIVGDARPLAGLVVIVSTLFYGGLALSIAARLYDSERLLYADDQRLSLGDWLRRLLFGVQPRTETTTETSPDTSPARAAGARDLAARRQPTAGEALALFGVAYVLLFFVFFPLQKRSLSQGLLISEWGGMLGLVIVYARFTGQRMRDVLVLRRPSARALCGAALCGLSAWVVVGLLADWIAPPPQEIVESIRRQILPPGGRGVLSTLFLMAITPAICEESLFRGPILRGLARQLSPMAAAVVTGVFFGLFHVDVWRLVPTGLLGVILSLIALRSGSIFPSMLAHALNNGCLVVMAELGLDDKVTRLTVGTQVAAFAAAVATLALGAFLVAGNRIDALTRKGGTD